MLTSLIREELPETGKVVWSVVSRSPTQARERFGPGTPQLRVALGFA